MIVLKYRDRETLEVNTFTAFIEPPLVHLRCRLRRNETAPVIDIAIATYVHERDTVPPKTELLLFSMTRLGGEVLVVNQVPLGPSGLRDQVYLIDVPEALANEWTRASRPTPVPA